LYWPIDEEEVLEVAIGQREDILEVEAGVVEAVLDPGEVALAEEVSLEGVARAIPGN
jgi:hypothetical protein